MHLLFVCTGNTCRSPMAAFFARREIHLRGLDWTADSAGLYAFAGAPMSALAADTLTRRHIPLTEHRAQPVTEELVRQADYVFAMTDSHVRELARRYPDMADKIYSLGRFLADDASAECDIVDPFGGSDDAYEAAAAALEQAVSRVIDRLVEKGSLE